MNRKIKHAVFLHGIRSLVYMISPLDTTILYLKFFRAHCHIRARPRQTCVAPYRHTIVMIKINIVATHLILRVNIIMKSMHKILITSILTLT